MIIAEYREFFFRSVQINNGSRPDKEMGYPVRYGIQGGTLVFNRLLKGHYPSENTLKKFAQSIPFKLDPTDTASDTQQGIVKAGTDAQVIAKTATFSDSMTRIVQPYQLPDVEEDDTMDVNNASTEDKASGINIREEVYTLPSSTKTRKRYLVSKRDFFYKTFTNLVSVLTNVTNIWVKTIPLKAFATDGDTILVDIKSTVNNPTGNSKSLKLYIDSTLVAALDILTDDSATLKVEMVRQSAGTDSVILVSSTAEYYTTFAVTSRIYIMSTVRTLTAKNIDTVPIVLSLVGQCLDAADVITVTESSIKIERN